MPRKPYISVGQLIDDSWETFRSKTTEYVTVSSWLLITAIFYVVALAFYPTASKLQLGALLTGFERFGIYLFYITGHIVAPILTFWILASLTRLASAHLARKKVDHATALKEGQQIFFPALVTTFLIMFMLILAIVIGFGPSAILAGLGQLVGSQTLIVISSILLIFGSVLAFYLSVKWMGYYFFAPIATMLDGVKGRAALEQSRKLVEGRFWGILARIIVPKLVFILFGVFVFVLLTYFFSIVAGANAGLNLDLQLRINTIIQSVVPIFIVIFINPLIVISDVLLYKSLKASQ